LDLDGGQYAHRFFLIININHAPHLGGDIFKMRTELQTKLIQHLNRKNTGGFTLIELLVVILIIGLLAGIALPHFLNQSAKTKESEAKQNITLVNKIQNAYREENQSFASTFDVLAIGAISGGATGSTKNYSYNIVATPDTATITATTLDAALKGYSGANIRYDNGTNQSVIGTVVCQMLASGIAVAAAPDISNVLAPPKCDNAVHLTLSI
jgi:type IV pilus assembly protein PilA